MKTENTLENKTKFFALYWGQKVKTSKKHKKSILKPLEINARSIEYCDKDSFLELESLDDISDEILNSLFQIEHSQPIDNLTNILMGNLEHYNTSYISEIIDKIRLNGFAWSWLGLTVQDLIDYGWVKIVK